MSAPRRPRRTVDPSYRAKLATISPQTSARLVGGYGTSVDRVLPITFGDSSIDADLHETLAAHEIVLWEDRVVAGVERISIQNDDLHRQLPWGRSDGENLPRSAIILHLNRSAT